MSRPRRKEPAPALPALTGRCLICQGPARDTSAAEVPEIMPYNGNRISADELEYSARQALGMKDGGCITFWKSGRSICWTTRLVGAAGDEPTDKALAARNRRGEP